jgi:cellulose biosynthesis protein BcsQ
MKSISIFNNKGGVGKTTLTFHLAHALASLGYKTLIIDLDPQCNLTIFGMDAERLHDIWTVEDKFIDDFAHSRDEVGHESFKEILSGVRSIHFLLKPTEDGTADLPSLPPPFKLREGLGLIPGRLTMHMYEDKIASRWSEIFQGDPLAIKTVTQIRSIAAQYSAAYGYDFVIIDTSPSLGVMNKVVISTTDSFMIPCAPDMFSLYGIRNIGKSLTQWKKQFDTVYMLLSDEKRKIFPEKFVQFVGYTIYNSKKYTGNNKWDLAQANYHYAIQIPDTIKKYIASELRSHLSDEMLQVPVGDKAIMHSHSTLPGMAQKYNVPIWDVPSQSLDADDRRTILGNRASYEQTKQNYSVFAKELVSRVSS